MYEVHHLLSKRSAVKKHESHIAKSVRHSEDTAANIVSALGDATPAAGEASVLFRSVVQKVTRPKKKTKTWPVELSFHALAKKPPCRANTTIGTPSMRDISVGFTQSLKMHPQRHQPRSKQTF